MKKILTLICAVALVSGASAQVKQAREVGAPLSAKSNQVVSPISAESVMGAAVKASANEDTLWAEAAYQAGRDGFYGLYAPTGVNSWDEVGTQPSVFWPAGTGWVNFIYGSGEIGYSFDLSDNGWLAIVGSRKGYNRKNVVGAIVRMGRARSTVEGITETPMPLRFKLYTMSKDQVTEQLGYDDITSTQGGEDVLEVYYPQDPEKFASYSNYVEVEYIEPTRDNPVEFKDYGARFETPSVAGDFACVSIMFPNEHNDKDTLWNASTMFFGDEGMNYIQSERPGSMYVVWDFTYQNMWTLRSTGEAVRERLEGFIPDSLAQPNNRYAVVPMCSWWWTNNGERTGDRMDGEVLMKAIFSDNVAIERGAAYDKYVEVKINPATDHTVIASTDKIKHVEIYTLNGKLVKTQACNDYFETISLSGLTSGMYIAKVTTEAGVANKKIMVR